MESGRFLLAVVLMIATVVIVNVLFPPTRRAASVAPDTATVSAPGALVPTSSPGTPPAARPDTSRPVAAGDSLSADTIIIQSPLYRYGISTRGAALVSAELLKYESFTRPELAPGVRAPVQLAPAGEPLVAHRAVVDGRTIEFSKIPFTPDQRRDIGLRDGDAPAQVRFSGTDPASGQTLELVYKFVPDNYLIEVSATVQPAGRSLQLLLDMGPSLAVNDVSISGFPWSRRVNALEDMRALAYVVNSRAEGIRSVPFQTLRPPRDGTASVTTLRTRSQAPLTRVEDGPLTWVALKNKYFLLAAIPGQTTANSSFSGLLVADLPKPWFAELSAALPARANEAARYNLYVGPQEYDRQVSLGLQDVNPMGWRWLRPIVRPLGHAFTWILLSSHRATGLAYGWVLILFGFAIRLALWPLNAKAMRSQMKTMELQPRVKEIQTRYKSNPEQMQKEMLKLYREEKFNPMGGCLPMLLPLPVLITLFFVFQSTIEFRGETFWWLPDLSRADPLFVMPLLVGITMFVVQWLSMRAGPPNPQAQVFLWIFPAMMTVMFLNFASGLNLYYVAQNVASVPQQLRLNQEKKRLQTQRRNR